MAAPKSFVPKAASAPAKMAPPGTKIGGKEGVDENGDVKQAGLEDSNIVGIGGKENRDLRKGAAETEKMFKGAGQKVGLQIWRVENKRTKSDTPDFGVNHWPKEDYGNFYAGDSYLLLNTYTDPENKAKILWDVHFWLGAESTQDEMGVAAYKAVELDDLLDDGPVQHREVQGHESNLFLSYFPKGIQIMKGGIASGFRAVKPEQYTPRLLHIRRTKNAVRASEVDCLASSMNHGDVFVLDAGLKIYTWVGEKSNAFEKMKGGAVGQNILSSRNGKAKKADIDDEFWKILKGTVKDVKGPDAHEEGDMAAIDPAKMKLFRLSDASGHLTFKKEAEGVLKTSMLDHQDVFIVDGGAEVFVWIGNGASKSEKSQAMKHAEEYLKEEKRPMHTPITRISEGQINFVFAGCFGK